MKRLPTLKEIYTKAHRGKSLQEAGIDPYSLPNSDLIPKDTILTPEEKSALLAAIDYHTQEAQRGMGMYDPHEVQDLQTAKQIIASTEPFDVEMVVTDPTLKNIAMDELVNELEIDFQSLPQSMHPAIMSLLNKFRVVHMGQQPDPEDREYYPVGSLQMPKPQNSF